MSQVTSSSSSFSFNHDDSVGKKSTTKSATVVKNNLDDQNDLDNQIDIKLGANATLNPKSGSTAAAVKRVFRDSVSEHAENALRTNTRENSATLDVEPKVPRGVFTYKNWLGTVKTVDPSKLNSIQLKKLVKDLFKANQQEGAAEALLLTRDKNKAKLKTMAANVADELLELSGKSYAADELQKAATCGKLAENLIEYFGIDDSKVIESNNKLPLGEKITRLKNAFTDWLNEIGNANFTDNKAKSSIKNPWNRLGAFLDLKNQVPNNLDNTEINVVLTNELENDPSLTELNSWVSAIAIEQDPLLHYQGCVYCLQLITALGTLYPGKIDTLNAIFSKLLPRDGDIRDLILGWNEVDQNYVLNLYADWNNLAAKPETKKQFTKKEEYIIEEMQDLITSNFKNSNIKYDTFKNLQMNLYFADIDSNPKNDPAANKAAKALVKEAFSRYEAAHKAKSSASDSKGSSSYQSLGASSKSSDISSTEKTPKSGEEDEAIINRFKRIMMLQFEASNTNYDDFEKITKTKFYERLDSTFKANPTEASRRKVLVDEALSRCRAELAAPQAKDKNKNDASLSDDFPGSKGTSKPQSQGTIRQSSNISSTKKTPEPTKTFTKLEEKIIGKFKNKFLEFFKKNRQSNSLEDTVKKVFYAKIDETYKDDTLRASAQKALVDEALSRCKAELAAPQAKDKNKNDASIDDSSSSTEGDNSPDKE